MPDCSGSLDLPKNVNINVDIVQCPRCFTFYREVVLTEVAYFSKLCYCEKFRVPALSDVYCTASRLEVCLVAVLALLMLSKWFGIG